MKMWLPGQAWCGAGNLRFPQSVWKLRSFPKVNRVEEFGLVKRDMGRSLTTDHRSASMTIIAGPAEGGHPTSIPQICFC